MKRILGLDVGEKRIGVAVSDPLGITAQALTTIDHNGYKTVLSSIRQLVDRYQIEKIVVGLPRHMNGDIGPEAESVMAFGHKLGTSLGIDVRYWDERLTTVAAEKTLLDGNTRRSRRRQVIDKLAASLILSGYLARMQAEQGSE
jgi:putative Holliday junction resolvase